MKVVVKEDCTLVAKKGSIVEIDENQFKLLGDKVEKEKKSSTNSKKASTSK